MRPNHIANIKKLSTEQADSPKAIKTCTVRFPSRPAACPVARPTCATPDCRARPPVPAPSRYNRLLGRGLDEHVHPVVFEQRRWRVEPLDRRRGSRARETTSHGHNFNMHAL